MLTLLVIPGTQSANACIMSEQLSRELRTETSPDLKRRRGIVALSLVASGSMSLIALYQMGIIKHLPEPPLPKLNADKVDASSEAYEKFAMPDAILGLGSYAATMSLAAKIAFDVANAAKLSIDQWTKHRAFCFWCLLAATATFAMAPLVWREAMSAVSAHRAAPAPH